MKTTIEIRDDLFYFAKEEALRRRTTFRAVIEMQLEKLAEDPNDSLSEQERARQEKEKTLEELKESGIEFNVAGFPFLSRKPTEDGSPTQLTELPEDELSDDLNRTFGHLQGS